MSYILMGLLAGIGMLLILIKLNLKRLAGYALVVDITLTVFFGIWFAGTISGLIAGMVAGIFVTLVFMFYTTFLGFDRFNFKDSKWEHTRGYFEKWSSSIKTWWSEFRAPKLTLDIDWEKDFE